MLAAALLAPPPLLAPGAASAWGLALPNSARGPRRASSAMRASPKSDGYTLTRVRRSPWRRARLLSELQGGSKRVNGRTRASSTLRTDL